MVAPEWIERLRKSDEVAGNESRPLVNQLVERVLAVGSWFSPINWTRVVPNLLPVKRDVFAVAFHRQLLEVGRKTFQVLLVGQDGDRLCPEEIVVPDRQKTHQHGQILLEGSSAEVFVHQMETIQHRLKILRANRDHG